ncbi:hypothetical protein NIES2107_37370 [Nostoc carneum NIES-2107]|nr:hypothetical protein NIES2107_37370 [Nostoc carneum NIES-2107]
MKRVGISNAQKALVLMRYAIANASYVNWTIKYAQVFY